MTNYQKEQFLLEEQFVKRLLIDYGIREVTTQKQAKNETREFEFPVPSYTQEERCLMKPGGGFGRFT